MGILHVLAAVRKQYWDVKGNIAVRRVTGRCATHLGRNASVDRQLVDPLHLYRTEKWWWSFSILRMDCFEPILILD